MENLARRNEDAPHIVLDAGYVERGYERLAGVVRRSSKFLFNPVLASTIIVDRLTG